jgi:hypothetical protein
MKHLRRFNESKEEVNYEDLKDFCEQNLVYLLDDERFELEVEDDIKVHSDLNSESGELYINLNCVSGNSNTGNEWLNGFFRWIDIKDHFIPFLIRLKNKYGSKITNSIHVKTRLDGWRTIELQDLIDDNTDERCKVIGNWWSIINIEITK